MDCSSYSKVHVKLATQDVVIVNIEGILANN